jgi:hypothetical protein
LKIKLNPTGSNRIKPDQTNFLKAHVGFCRNVAAGCFSTAVLYDGNDAPLHAARKVERFDPGLFLEGIISRKPQKNH